MQKILGDQAIEFLKHNDTAVLSTVDRSGNVHGAVIHYFLDESNRIYVLTRAATSKAKDILTHNQVALTVYNREQMQTVQLQGATSVEIEPVRKMELFRQLVQPKIYDGRWKMPPATKLWDEMYIIVRIDPVSGRFSDFSKETH